MKRMRTHAAAGLLAAAAVLGGPQAASAACADPLPIDPDVVTRELGLKGFNGGSLLVYGPTWLARRGQKFTSTRQAAERYGAESPKGVEPVPGVANAYTVFDPKTPNRRVFVEYGKKVYMIVSSDSVPLATLAKAVLQK